MAVRAAWRWLQDPCVVARFQKLCGLEQQEDAAVAAAAAAVAPCEEGETRSNNGGDHLDHRDGHEQQQRSTERCCNGLGTGADDDDDDDNDEVTVTTTTTTMTNGTSNRDLASSRKARHRRPGATPDHGDLQPPRHGPNSATTSTTTSTTITDQLHQEPSRSSIMELPRRRNSLSQEVHTPQAFVVRRRALHYLFVLGTELGNETFYITFFPFLFWNVDALVARRIIMVWVWVMFLGQSAKDLLRWPRPASPPVIKVEVFYDSEYGMPSTHAMSGTALPFAIFALTLGRFEYPAVLGLALACCWCLLVCLSRLYMGMHSILDVVVGVLCSVAILSVLLPSLETLDSLVLHWGGPAEASSSSQNQATVGGLAWWLRGVTGGAAVALAHVAAALAAFTLDGWSTSRGDTAQILAVGAGVASGSRVNRLLGLLATTQAPSKRLPLPVLPGLPQLPGALVRTIARVLLGSAILLATKAALKSTSIPLACWLFSIPGDDVSVARRHAQVELPYRFITYGAVGFSAACLVPCAFSLVGLS
ncbi:sphingosine-1-phosphate phosphatase 1 [Lampetra planeri]